MNTENNMRVIDPNEIFALDQFNWRVMNYEIGNSNNRILVIRNFFKNPDKLREYAESVDYVDTINGQVSGIPGYIHRIGNGIKTILRPMIGIVTGEFEASENANSAPAAISGVRDSIGPVNPRIIPTLTVFA